MFTAIPQTARNIGREVPQSPTPGNIEGSSTEKHICATPFSTSEDQVTVAPSSMGTPARRYPARLRKPPEKLNL